jgi:hypothetical protein
MGWILSPAFSFVYFYLMKNLTYGALSRIICKGGRGGGGTVICIKLFKTIQTAPRINLIAQQFFVLP